MHPPVIPAQAGIYCSVLGPNRVPTKPTVDQTEPARQVDGSVDSGFHRNDGERRKFETTHVASAAATAYIMTLDSIAGLRQKGA